ncbi:uncharacterized protein PHACADRAFT_251166 [Phanerochaete carnosa HHB-10118-sp]|uniref:Uncharacterized protein n=1 Tax=Phanerochaete carnosa (strain HHB-10118-sp) TaxID=650164 RepID=K5X3U6_PHACS|nr:uncharacterized protein PHACADRAFT_251166 [Phanerochaete carnosa HHB-10118-sp]EKM57492.1 hypothetical protein PHACADRAFT_251166 [Phanerochaete carnosa HHB-10118-sp]
MSWLAHMRHCEATSDPSPLLRATTSSANPVSYCASNSTTSALRTAPAQKIVPFSP